MRDARGVLEVVAIGDELLLGDTLESNGAWLGRALGEQGIRVGRRTIVGDDAQAIRAAVADALERTGLVICSGGLGPTRDDVTKNAVAELYGRALRIDVGWLDRLRERFAARGITMTPSNEQQAAVPEGAIVFDNARGTAPGLAVEDERGATVLLPGVPIEFRGLIEDRVRDWLVSRMSGRSAPIRSRVLRTTGVPESRLGERVDDLLAGIAPLSLAFLPSTAGVDLRFTSWGTLAADEADQALERAVDRFREHLGISVYATGADELAAIVGAALVEKGFTLALAESCTGGLIAKWLTDAPGASRFFMAGLVTYADDAKRDLLGVPADTLATHGAVSEESVLAMVEGARRATGASAGIAVTGIAGPEGGTPTKPVGTVWIAAAVGPRVQSRLLRLRGTRSEIRERCAQAALDLLRRLLLEPLA